MAAVVLCIVFVGWESMYLAFERDLSRSSPWAVHQSSAKGQQQLSQDYDKVVKRLEAQHYNMSTPEEPPELQRVLITIFLFGEKTANKRSFRMFVESTRRSGVDFCIVGYPKPPFALPPNVRYVEATWDDLTDRVKNRLFRGQEPGEMRSVGNYYKINDFKPLFAYLFPEVVEGYSWWGYMDSDLVVGNLRRFLNEERLLNYDIISGVKTHYTTGPFMLYRNTPVINELFKLARRPLMEIFGVERCRSFDEYGGIFYGLPRGYNPGWNDFRSSFGGILEHHHKRLGLRWYGSLRMVWDGHCRGYLEGGMCKECHLKVYPNGKQELYQYCFGSGYKNCRPEVFLCHYQYSKLTMEESLANVTKMEAMIAEGQYRINFMDGFNPLNSTARQFLAGAQMLQMPYYEDSGPRTFRRPRSVP